MRAAFLFSGQLRGFTLDGLDTLKQNLFSVFEEYDTFFYIPPEDLVPLINCYNPTVLLCEPDQYHPDVEGFGDQIGHSNNIPGYRVLNNALQHYWIQWYGVKRVFELFDSYRKVNNKHYDVVFRMRCDMRFTSKLNYEPFDGIQIPDHHGHGGIYDRMAYGPVEHMRYYCSIYDEIRKGKYKENINLGNSESKLMQHLAAYSLENNVAIKFVKVPCHRIRMDGSYAPD